MCLLHQFDGDLLRGVCLGQVDRINRRVLETRLGVPFLRVERETGTVTPFISEGVEAGVDIRRPGFQILAADDVDHPSYGIGAIESRRGSFHNLYAPYVVEIQTVVVRVVHGLSSQAFTIDKEEHGIAAKTAHVE